MRAINRRLFAGASLASLAAPAALASPVAADHPDAALLALGREWEVLRDAYEAADALSSAGWAEWTRTMPLTPDVLLVREGDAALGVLKGSELEDGRVWYDPGAVDRLRGRKPGRYVERPVTSEEVIAVHNAWRAELDALNSSLDLDGLEARLEEAAERSGALERRIALAPASTLDGLALKARVAVWITGEDGPFDPADEADADAVTLFGTSIMRDLLVLNHPA